MADLFQTKNIVPMLIADNAAPFADDAYLYEMKWDGLRCLAYLDPNEQTELRNKRNVRMLPKVPELSNIHKQARKRCIIDGELLCLVDGKPSFETIQRRSLMSSRLKIEMEARRYPAAFIAFDCLYYDGTDLMLRPLSERREYLQSAILESERLAASRVFDASQALELFQLTQAQNLEGIVEKQKDSLYFQGKRTKAWKKIKNLMDDDFVVCGYSYKENRMISVILGQYLGEKLVYKGHVTLGVGGPAFAKIKSRRRLPQHPFDEAIPERENRDAVWLEPQTVCVVEFMYRTKSGGMRQPVFKGLRADKTARECVVK